MNNQETLLLTSVGIPTMLFLDRNGLTINIQAMMHSDVLDYFNAFLIELPFKLVSKGELG